MIVDVQQRELSANKYLEKASHPKPTKVKKDETTIGCDKNHIFSIHKFIL